MYNTSTLILNSFIFPFIALIGLTAYLFLRHSSWGVRRIPFVVITSLLVLAECGKQVYELITGSYSLFSLPFHICTIVIVGYVLVSFLDPNRKIVKIFWAMSMTAGFVVTLAILIAPNPIIGWQSNTLFEGKATYVDWYSVIVHYVFVVLFVLTLTLNMYHIRLKDILMSSVIWTGSLLIILIAANTLGVNYANFLDFKLQWINIEELGLQLFQTIMFVAYIAVYLIVSLIIYSFYHLIQETGNIQLHDCQYNNDSVNRY